MTKQKQHNKQFKENAVIYVKEHPNLTQKQCAKNLVSVSTPLPDGSNSTVTQAVKCPTGVPVTTLQTNRKRLLV